MKNNSNSVTSSYRFSNKFKFFLAGIVAFSSFSLGGNSELFAKNNYPKSGVKAEASQKIFDTANSSQNGMNKDNYHRYFNSVHSPRIGFKVGNELDMNKGTLYRKNNGEKCLDNPEYSRIHARFVSEKTPPAHGRRVIIRNITDGMDMYPYPYTDREYDQGSVSEATILEKGYTHRNRSLSVLKGKNIFEYKITEMGKVIDSGKFTFTLNIQNQDMNKNSRPMDSYSCYDDAFLYR